MRKLNSQFITRFLSEPGLDGQNGTYYGFVEMDHYFCMAVAEGYDGEGGRDSAKLAVDAAMEAFVQRPGMSKTRLRMCLKKAHKSLMDQSVRIRLKAGILLLVSDYTRFRYASCGNVMLYALRNAGIYHQNSTHTVYQSMLDERKEPDMGALEKETKNLYHYLGGSAAIAVSRKLKLEDGDVLLAGTEGFWSRVGKVEILDAYESIKSEEDFLGDLQELYLRGSTDSVPCCCLAAVSIKKAYRENTARKKKILLWSAILVLILAIGGSIAYFTVRSRKRKQQEIRTTVETYGEAGDQYLLQFNGLLAKGEYEKAAEAAKSIKKNEEKLQEEKEISGKISISSLLESAGKAYEGKNYTQARTDYKKAMEMVKAYPELVSLTGEIEQRLKLVSAGMEINHYIQSAALKEAEGDLEAASILYDRAEAMLRILDDPERLQQVQLAKLRVQSQEDQAGREERAKARDAVIIEADETAAMDAVLAGDFEMALELYTKIRDSYIALEENEKAEQTTAIILSLQKQAMASGQEKEEEIKGDKSAALEAVLAGDRKTAIQLYEKVRDAYLTMEEDEKAGEIADIITALKKQPENDAPDNTASEAGPGQAGPGQPEAATQAISDSVGPGSAKGPMEETNSLNGVIEPLQENALRLTAEKDFEGAIEQYRLIRQIYLDSGNSEMAAWIQDIIAGLISLYQDSNAEGGVAVG